MWFPRVLQLLLFQLQLTHEHDHFLVYMLSNEPPFTDSLILKYRDVIYSYPGAKGLLKDATFNQEKHLSILTTNHELGKYVAIFAVFQKNCNEDDMLDLELAFNVIFNLHLKHANTQEQAIEMYKVFVARYDFRLYKNYAIKRCGSPWERVTSHLK